MPFSGRQSMYWLRLRNMAQRTAAPLSLRVKYQWPEGARVRLEISPAIQARGRLRSKARRAMRLSSLTLMTGGDCCMVRPGQA